MAHPNPDERRHRGWRWLWVSLLSLNAVAADDAAVSARIDQEWRDRYVMGIHADAYRHSARMWASAQAGLEAARGQRNPRTELRAAARYFALMPNPGSAENCPLLTHYVDMARKAGADFERELFDLGAATVWTAVDKPCPARVTSQEMEALAQRLGDPARQFYVMQAQLTDSLQAGRQSDGTASMTRQLDYAISGIQRAHVFYSLAQLEFQADAKGVAARPWLERAAKEVDQEEFELLGVKVESDLAIIEFRANNAAAAMSHVRRLLPHFRTGALPPATTSMNLVSFANHLIRLDRLPEAMELLNESLKHEITRPRMLMSRASVFLAAYAKLKTPEAFAKGEREVQRINDLRSASPDLTPGIPTLRRIVDFYASYGKYDAAFQAQQQLMAAIEEQQRKSSETTRVELQEKLNVALKDKENARLRAEAELQAERQHGWIVAFCLAAVGVLGAGAALAVAVRRGRRLARVSAELEERNGELERRSASRIRLLAAACHDLRQPAHALGMLAELGGEARQEPSRFAPWLQSVRRSTASLGEMLDELMDLGRLDGGHYTPLLSEVPLGELMQEVMLHFGPLARRKGLTLDVPSVDVTITSDRHLLRRILFNVVSNAIKYTDTGGVQVALETLGAQIRLSVQDTGSGIPQDKIDDVFRDYVRLNPIKAAEGLGIGLSIVRRAAELLGHELTLKSAPGEGTCVALMLPMSGGKADIMGAAAADESATPTGGTVAVMENDAEVREVMAALLQGWGYTVCAGPDAGAVLALATAQALKPALVITDLHLDNTDGLREVARLREGLGSPALPALLVTGDLDAAVTGQAAMVGVYVTHKPLAPRKLATLVRKLLSAPDELLGASASERLPAPL